MKEVVNEAVKFAEESPEPDIAAAGEAIFAPPYEAGQPEPLSPQELRAYASALKNELDREEKRARGDRTPLPKVQDDLNPPLVID